MGDSYLPAYRIGIMEGGALGMMCSYTTVNGTAMCESAEWQQKWAREKLGAVLLLVRVGASAGIRTGTTDVAAPAGSTADQ